MSDIQVGDTVTREHPSQGTAIGMVAEVREGKVRVAWTTIFSNKEWVDISEIKCLPRKENE